MKKCRSVVNLFCAQPLTKSWICHCIRILYFDILFLLKTRYSLTSMDQWTSWAYNRVSMETVVILWFQDGSFLQVCSLTTRVHKQGAWLRVCGIDLYNIISAKNVFPLSVNCSPTKYVIYDCGLYITGIHTT